MVKIAALALLLALPATAASSLLSNEEFCKFSVSRLADSLLERLAVSSSSGIIVRAIEGRFGGQLRHDLLACLSSRGHSVFTAEPSTGEALPNLSAEFARADLSYSGLRKGLFSKGRVRRDFRADVYAQLSGTDGRLLRSVALTNLVLSDTLSYNDARLARGSERFMGPELPPSLYQRLVEPGLVLGITGGLVYLFFASR